MRVKRSCMRVLARAVRAACRARRARPCFTLLCFTCFTRLCLTCFPRFTVGAWLDRAVDIGGHVCRPVSFSLLSPHFFCCKKYKFCTGPKKSGGSGQGMLELGLWFFAFLFSECVHVCVCVLSVFVCRGVSLCLLVCLMLCLWLCVCNRWRWQSNNPNGYRGNDNN